LRGLKESGRLFAGPTYIYVVALYGLILVGLGRSYFGDLGPLPVNQEALDQITQNGALLTGTTALIMLRAFSSGAVALTGVEAIADGVPAFRKPESKNAATTLTWMAVILGTAFFGLAVLTHRLQPTVSEDETLLSIMGKAVYGSGSLMYYVLQFSTFAILILAANTAFADFRGSRRSLATAPPRQMANRATGWCSRTASSSRHPREPADIAFDGDTAALIPLYAVSVFTSHPVPVRHVPVPALAPPVRLATAVGHQPRRMRDLRRAAGRRGLEFTKAWIPAVVIRVVVLFVQINATTPT
jgi:amino acid transporter